MARVKVCPLCEAHNGPDELFCADCGGSLADVRVMDTVELDRLKAEAEAETCGAEDATDSTAAPTEPVPPVSVPAQAVGGQTVRDQSAPRCALLFPWGRTPVAEQLGIGREAGFSAISQQLDAYPTVSRQHAVISVVQGQWTVRDLGSTNGTYVNGAQLANGETRTIANGDRVGFSRGLQVQVEIGA